MLSRRGEGGGGGAGGEGGVPICLRPLAASQSDHTVQRILPFGQLHQRQRLGGIALAGQIIILHAQFKTELAQVVLVEQRLQQPHHLRVGLARGND